MTDNRRRRKVNHNSVCNNIIPNIVHDNRIDKRISKRELTDTIFTGYKCRLDEVHDLRFHGDANRGCRSLHAQVSRQHVVAGAECLRRNRQSRIHR